MTSSGDPLLVERAGNVDATVTIPGSKSITNRALVCAALAEGASRITGALRADDTTVMVECLRALGATISWTGDVITVEPGLPPDDTITVDAGKSGTTSRFLLPVLALSSAPRRLSGDQQLLDRPMGPAFEALRQIGAGVEETKPGHLPAVVRGPIRSPEVSVSGDVSSQFLSGLLLAGPKMPDGLVIRLTTELISRPYVDMTVAVMEAFGAVVTTPSEREWVVEPAGYRGADYLVEPDASAASYAWAAAVVTGGTITVPGLHRGSLQGDVGFVDVLEQMGARVRWDDDAVTVAAGDHLHGIDVDMAHISDTVPTLAAVAAMASSPTTIRNVGFIRGKESDRIAAPVTELQRCGIDAVATDDGMVITPGPIHPASFATYGDHRMAMSLALLGLAHPGVEIQDPSCVDKTFPGFWDMLDQLRSGSLNRARSAV